MQGYAKQRSYIFVYTHVQLICCVFLSGIAIVNRRGRGGVVSVLAREGIRTPPKIATRPAAFIIAPRGGHSDVRGDGGDRSSKRAALSRGGAEKLCILKSVSRREHECLVRLVFEPPFERLILRVVEG
jgi:hypothetical protein